MRVVPVLLGLFAVACADESLGPRRSVRLQLEVAGLPDGASAEYRVFVHDSTPIAHGRVANLETDTVRVSSSLGLKVRWQDALLPVGDAEYIFAPSAREQFIEESAADTTATLATSYALVSGGFILSVPGLPMPARWLVWNMEDSVLAGDILQPGEVVRRGDLPPGLLRLQLDTVLVETEGLYYHEFAPPQHEVLLNVSASLDLIAIEAPYAPASAIVHVGASGLPAGTSARWRMYSMSGSFGTEGTVLTGTAATVDRLRQGTYSIEWDEVTVDGITYRPNPTSQTATLESRLEPYEFSAVYSAAP
jgi:hypothetical protein